MVLGLNSGRGKRLFSPPRRPKRLQDHPASYSIGTGSLSGIKRRARDINHLPFSAVIKHDWSYTCTASACLHSVDRKNFTFTFIYYLFIYLFIRGVLTDTVDRAIQRRMVGCLLKNYSHAPHNDVSVNDGPHIRRWSHYVVLQYLQLCYNYLQYSVQ